MLYITTDELISTLYPLHKNGLLDSDTIHVFATALLCKLPHDTQPVLAINNTALFHDFWLAHIPRIVSLVTRLDGKSFSGLPKLNITVETLSNLPYWIDDLHSALKAASIPISEEAKRLNRESYKSAFLNEKLALGEVPIASLSVDEKESLITRAIRGSVLSPKEQAAFPQLIADWADKETQFPLTTVRLKNGNRTTTKAVWQTIITKSIKAGNSYLDLISSEFGIEDIQDLESHLLCGLGSSSNKSKFLFGKLAEAIEVISEFTLPIVPVQVSTRLVESQERYEISTGTVQAPTDRVLSSKEKLAIKLAKLRMKR